MGSTLSFLRELLIGKETTVSDVTPENQQATPQPPPPDPRIAELEAENASLKEQLAAAQTTATATITTTSSNTPDWSARIDELKTQGLSDEDAVQQAAYEERLWNDQHTPTA